MPLRELAGATGLKPLSGPKNMALSCHCKLRLILLSCAIAFSLSSILAEDPSPQARALERAAKVEDLTSQLRVETKEDAARYTPEFRDRLTGQVRELLKEQVLDTLADKGVNLDLIRDRLKAFVAVPVWHEFSGAPYALEATLSGVPITVVGFELLRGGAGAPETKVFIQAYRKSSLDWEYVAGTGDDLDGYGFFLVDLKSPRPEEMWLLAYGVKTGSNDLTMRMRVYAFDGGKFSTILSAPDRHYGKVTVAGDELVVKSLDYETRLTRTERYLLTSSGIIPLSSTLALEFE